MHLVKYLFKRIEKGAKDFIKDEIKSRDKKVAIDFSKYFLYKIKSIFKKLHC